jgi:hypothetical protein
MQTEFMLLAIYNKPRLSPREVCEAIGMSMKTAYNQRSANTFPIPLSGDPLRRRSLPRQAANVCNARLNFCWPHQVQVSSAMFRATPARVPCTTR